jgi:hypothetical protein
LYVKFKHTHTHTERERERERERGGDVYIEYLYPQREVGDIVCQILTHTHTVREGDGGRCMSYFNTHVHIHTHTHRWGWVCMTVYIEYLERPRQM